MAWLQGVLIGFATIVLSRVVPSEAVYPIYAALLALAAGVYVGFAAGSGKRERTIQWIVALFFAAIAVVGLVASPLFLSAGWVLHAGWDYVHHAKIRKLSMPKAYPALCIGYDLTVAAYIVWLTQ